MAELRLIESHELILSPLNPRTAAPSEAEVAALAGSIAELGLLQNLIGLDRGERLEIVGGGLRLRALLTLPSQEVEVLVYDDAEAAVAAALAENEVRREMGPVDRFRAFLALREAGRSEAAIARAYATDTAEVARILALKACAPEVLEALGERRINLDQARAFTVTRDLGRQVEVLAGLSPGQHPDTIRRKLRARDDEQDVLRALKLVGLEAYEAAGGAVIRDLFSSTVFVEDHALLYRLRDERVAVAAETEMAAGWSWAEVGEVPGAQYMDGAPSPDPLSEDEGDRLSELEGAAEDGDLDPGDAAELAELRARSEREAEGVFSVDQMAVGGVRLSVSWGGEIVRERGLVRPEDQARAVELGVLPAPRAADGPAPEGGTEESEPEGYPAAVVADLHGLAAILVRGALAQAPEMALWVLAWHMASGASGLLNAQLRAGETADGAKLLGHAAAAPASRERIGFADFMARGKKHRNAVLAAEIAAAFGMGWSDGARAGTAEIAAAAGVDLRKLWTPDAALFKRLKAGQLEALFVDLTEVGFVNFEISKKADMVAMLARLFAEPRETLAKLQERTCAVAPDAEARIAAWLPEPLRPPAEAEAEEAKDRAA